MVYGTQYMSMKRRTLIKQFSVVGGVGVMGFGPSISEVGNAEVGDGSGSKDQTLSTESDCDYELGDSVRLTEISEVGASIELDGFDVDDVSWISGSQQLIAQITVTSDESCSEKETSIDYPTENPSQSEVTLQAIDGETEVIFGRVVRNSEDELTILYSNS